MASQLTPPAARPQTAASGWLLFAGALCAALAGALGAYALQYEPDRPFLKSRDSAPLAAPLPAPPLLALQDSGTRPAWLQVPLGDAPVLTLAELLELRAALTNVPDSSGEFTRLAEQMLFADAAHRFQQLRAQGGEPAELTALAHLLDDTLDARLRRNEIVVADARMLKTQVLQVRVADPAERQAEFVRWDAARAATLDSSGPNR